MSCITIVWFLPDNANHHKLLTHTGQFSGQQQLCGYLDEPLRLTDVHHGSLLGQLSQHATKWRDIGPHLGFLPGELSNIEASPNLMQGAPVSWLGAMLAQWLQRTSFPTLEDLKSALSKAGLAAAAHDLKLWLNLTHIMLYCVVHQSYNVKVSVIFGTTWSL